MVPPIRTVGLLGSASPVIVTSVPPATSTTFGLSEVPSHGGVGHPLVYLPLLTGTALLSLFIWHARRVAAQLDIFGQ